MTDFECTKLDSARERSICEGTSGLPATGPGNTREGYIKLWTTRAAAGPPKKSSEGLGDTIAKITAATGLAWFAEKAAKAIGLESCGCAERQAILNELFPYAPADMSGDEWHGRMKEIVNTHIGQKHTPEAQKAVT